MLYEVKLHPHKGKTGLVLAYVLYEHKSEPEELTVYQILVYMVSIWEQRKKQKRKPILVPIIPIVIYHGKKAWDAPTLFRDLFPNIQDELVRYLPNFEIDLFDLSAYTDEEINGDVRLRLYFSTLMYVYHRRVLEQFIQVFNFLAEVLHQQTGRGYMDTVIRYIAQVEGVKEEELRVAFENSLLTKEVEMTTLAQIWTERARQEGRQEGKQEGLWQGLIYGIEAIIDIKFGAEAKPLLAQISNIRDIDLLQNIQSFLKTAKTADEVKSYLTPYAQTS